MERRARSASCRRAEAGFGFTLIEVMVVLALVAALIALAFPQVVRLYTRTRIAFEREDLERQLAALPEEVRADGRAAVLGDASGAAEPAGAEAPRRLSLQLPPNWTIKVPRPILYHFTGACDGGEVILSLPPLSLHYELTAPLCRPRLVAGG